MLEYSELLEVQVQSAKMLNRINFLAEVKSAYTEVLTLKVLKEEHLRFVKSRETKTGLT